MQPGDDATTSGWRIHVTTKSLGTNLEEIVSVGQRVPSQGLLVTLET